MFCLEDKSAPTKNTNLPPRMRRRVQRSGRVFYYYDTGGKPRREIPLGPDYLAAVQKWAELEADFNTPAPIVTFRDAAMRYVRDVLPSKAQRTKEDNIKELEILYEFFDNPPAALDLIEPQHIYQYRTWRIEKTRAWLKKPAEAGGVRANRELALFSHIFNYAREMGLTAAPNLSIGLRKTREHGRDVYVEDSLYAAVHKAADQPLRDAMDLAYLTRQRPADTLALDERDIRDDALEIQQGKTDKRLIEDHHRGDAGNGAVTDPSAQGWLSGDQYSACRQRERPALGPRGPTQSIRPGTRRGRRPEESVPVPRSAGKSWHRQSRKCRRYPPGTTATWPHLARSA